MTPDIKLTEMERKYFKLLLETDGVVPNHTFGEFHDDFYGSNKVAVHMMNLRRKIKSIYVIESHRGIGYSMHKP